MLAEIMAHNCCPARARPGILVATMLMLGCNNHGSSEYGLPIMLGSSSDEVRRVLGSPHDSHKDPRDERWTVEWYYTHGIVAAFERDRLIEIRLFPDHGMDTYKGFLTYSGEIIRGHDLPTTNTES